jgi:epoxyqueuosine reductase
MATLEDSIKEFARSVGFSLVGIAPATEADGFDHLQNWLAQGYAGEMGYMHTHAEARRHPSSILAEVRSVIMVTMEYAGPTQQGDPKVNERRPQSDDQIPANFGKVSRYASGEDYHKVMWKRLNKLLSWLTAEVPGCRGRGVVDTAPLMERDFARRAGLGWIGKNTMLINKERGSYFFIGALLTDVTLQPDPQHAAEHCGTCTACLDACPTDAFTAPGSLDARRCIAYLTIELRGAMPKELRDGVGDWMFGCDICQEVCPWNRRDNRSPQVIDAISVLAMDQAAFREKFGSTAISRAKHQGLARNAAIVLGNSGDERCIPALQIAVADPDPAVSESAGWALDQVLVRTNRLRGRESEMDSGKLACSAAKIAKK